MPSAWAEVPPTAGLPPRWADAWPLGARAPLRPPGIDDALLLCSGTAALVVALHTLAQRSARREVVVPAYTCPLVARAVAHCGLRLRLCDLAPDRLDFDADSLRRACGEDTLAVVPTHLGGRVADVATAAAVARAAGAWVIEDAAQAWGALGVDAPVGRLGDMAFFSLAVGKGITLYEGGVLTARDAALRDALRAGAAALAPPRRGWEWRRSLELLGYLALYRPLPLRLAYGWPHRRALRRGDWIGAVGDDFGPRIPLHAVGAWRRRVGERMARRWPAYADALRAQAQRRLPLLRALPGAIVFDDAPGTCGAWPFLWLQLPSAAARDAALAELAPARLGVTRLYVHALPDYPYLRGVVEATAAVPNARALAARSLTVSNSLWCDDAAFARVLAVLRRVLGAGG
ncbi:MAG: DegT/DnrJ/EryC1/StrS family aminotransferase [Lysobacterales bacterium]